MPELIDRQAALRLCIEGSGLYDEGFIEGYNFAVSEIREKLQTLPTIEQEVRHGRWYDHAHTDTGVCSECGCVFTDETPYCPNCGAKMDGGEKNEGN